MLTFQKNGIMCGNIYSSCLICERYFVSDEQTFAHIQEEEHETKLQLHPYMEKYGHNHIRKVNAGYFCEHCGLLMNTAAKVNLHIAEQQHYYNKGNGLLKLSGSVIIAFDDILITESAWNSFADDTCVSCDVEFDDQNEHKMERSHVVKLLQNEVQFGKDNNIYRKIGKNNIQCLTCNCLETENALDDHFNSDGHKQKYIQCQEDKNKFDLENPEEMEVKTQTETELETAVSDNVDNNLETVAGNAVTNDIQSEQKTQDLQTKSEPQNIEESNDPAIFATHHNIAYDPRNSNALCKTCEKRFPSTLRGMKEHIQGRDHINKMTKPSKSVTKKPEYITRSMEFYVNSILTFDNTLDNDTIINESICVPEKSCHMYTKIRSKFAEYKCELCMENLSEDDLTEHSRTTKHEKGMRLSKVVYGLDDELVREVRPDTFHCGYCNLIVAGYPATLKHLKCAEHKAASASCHRRLQIHMPTIQARKNDEKFKTAFAMFMNEARM